MFSITPYEDKSNGCQTTIRFKRLSAEKQSEEPVFKHSREMCQEYVNMRASDFTYWQLNDILQELISRYHGKEEQTGAMLKQAMSDLQRLPALQTFERFAFVDAHLLPAVDTLIKTIPMFSNVSKTLSWALEELRFLTVRMLN